MTFEPHISLREYRKMGKVKKIFSEYWKRDYLDSDGHTDERVCLGLLKAL